MNKYLKEFFHRGLIFAGFGPIILGIIYYIISETEKGFSLSGYQVCLGIISIYVLAFVQAGATVFNQIEDWSLPKSLVCHFSTLYITYILCYVVNTWIPFKPMILLIFTLIFISLYLIIWITVYFTIKISAKKFNSKLIKN